jgi:hypothetical protein
MIISRMSTVSIAQAPGDGHTRQGGFERAKCYLDTALDCYRRNGMKPHVPRILQSLLDRYEQQNCAEEAERPRVEARRLLEEMLPPPVRPPDGLSLAPGKAQAAG